MKRCGLNEIITSPQCTPGPIDAHRVPCGLVDSTLFRKAFTVATESTTPITLSVMNAQGQSVGTVEVDPADLGGKINKQLLHEVVLMYLANQRAGTHSTLRRGEVAGSTKKLFRQKGTGNARVGSRRSNKRKGGGTAKGPKPRDYEYHLPKKAVQSATRMAILSRLQDQETVVIDDLKLPEIKTKAVFDVLKALQISDKTCLIGLAKSDIDANQTIYKSARNICGMAVLPASQLNAYQVLKPKRLVLTKAALQELCKNAKWK
jgi:large subunit ribosomal protein L4